MAHPMMRGSSDARHVLVFEKREQVWQFMEERFREIGEGAVGERGRFSVALSGGKTPKDLYVEIAGQGRDMHWKDIHVFLVDERFVPRSTEMSNYGMIEKNLLQHVPIPDGNIHPIGVKGGDVNAWAAAYEEELLQFFGILPGSVPAFDLVLLGMGEDGHTASLFPGMPDVRNDRRLVRPIEAAGERVARVTLTLRVINSARNVFFLVTGEAKAQAVHRVVDEQDPSLPATLVLPENGALFFLCDAEAGSMLLAERKINRL